MKRIILGFVAAAMASAIAPTALADPITGSIAVVGFDDQWSATGVTFNNSVALAGNATGSFASVIGPSPAVAAATIDASSWTFSSPDELIFTVGADTATLTTTGAVDVTTDTDAALDISGVGTLTLTGYDPTSGSFSFSSGDSNDDYGASGSSTFQFDVGAGGGTPYDNITPEPGSLILLGTGLAGLAGILSRKRSTRQTTT
jgi:hypothetical protein